MNKINYRILILILSIGLLIGCGVKEKNDKVEIKKEVVEITIARFMKSADENSIKKFNDYLKSEKIPYRVKFIQYMEEDADGNITNYEPGTYMNLIDRDIDKIDLFIANNSFESDFDYMDMVKRNLAEPLDDFIQGEGISIYNSMPKESWDSIRINEKLYSIPMYVGLDITTKGSIYYGLKKTYADKYNIDISEWGPDFWNHKEELNRIIQGEKGNKEFSLFNPGIYSAITEFYPGYTPVTSSKADINPYVYDEENGKVINIYESEPIKEIDSYFRELYNANEISYAYNPSEEGNILELIHVDDSYYFKEAKTYLKKATIYDIAISRESKQKKEVYEFLKLVYTDKDMLKAIEDSFGSTGLIIGNGFYDKYAFKNDDIKNIKERYSKLDKSDIYGFVFDNSMVRNEMNDISIYLYERNRHIKGAMIKETDLNKDIKKLKELGIDKVLYEMNIQIQEFKNKSSE